MKFFAFCILFCSVTIQLFAQKKLKDSVVVLNLQIDSFKTQLADARRAFKKCSEQQNTFHVESLTKQQQQNFEIDKLKQVNADLGNTLKKIEDSLQNSVQASLLLQKIIAEKDLKQSIAINKANDVVQKLKDSLLEIIGNQCYIYLSNEKPTIVISDSILFSGNNYLSNRGKQILNIITKIILENPGALKIKTFANRNARNQEIWNQPFNKSRTITTHLESINFSSENYELLFSTIASDFINYQIRPVVFEITLK